MFALALLLLAVAGVYSETHSLQYYYTGVSTPGPGLPEFSIVGYVDDEQVTLYTSDTSRTVPVAQWMKEKEAPERWEQATRFDRTTEELYKFEANLWKKRFNHMEGFDYLQVILRCELQDDGSTVGFLQFRYDGREFMDLDILKGFLIPTDPDARIVTERWNSPNVRLGEICKMHLETECIVRLKRFIEHGREVLERRVRPRVKVSGQEKDGAMKLHCQVYGFHPQAVDVKWMNGKDEVPAYETTHVLPNPDGTYQIRASAEVTPKDGDSYSCYVDHSSLEEPLLVRWEPKQNMVPAVIISLGVIILVILASAGFIIYKKKNYSAASGRRAGTESQQHGTQDSQDQSCTDQLNPERLGDEEEEEN